MELVSVELEEARRFRRAWPAVALVVALAVALAGLAVVLVYRQGEAALRDHIAGEVRVASDGVAAHINTARFYALAIERELVKRPLDEWIDDRKGLDAILAAVDRLNPEDRVASFAVVSSDGHVLAHSARTTEIDATVADRDYFRAIQAGAAETVGKPIKGRVLQTLVLPYAKLVELDGARLIVLSAIRVQAIEQTLSAYPDTMLSAIALLMRDGTPVETVAPTDPFPTGAKRSGWIISSAPVGSWPLDLAGGAPTSRLWAEIALPALLVFGVTLVLAAGLLVAFRGWAERREAYATLARIEQQQEVMLHELNHRLRNLLATVQSVASLTRRSSRDLDEFDAAFRGRMTVLTAAASMAAVRDWREIELRELVDRVLAPHRAADDRISTGGPEAVLSRDAGLALSLMLHELATNALKYGALSVPGGRVDLRWRIEDQPVRTLRLDWTETGGPQVVPPSRQGFGSKMIRQVTQQFGGEAEHLFEESGVRCTIRVRLDRIAALAAA